MRTMLAVFAAAVVVVFTAPPVLSKDDKTNLDAPPAGITATSATLQAVLDAYKKATGQSASPVRTMIEDDAVTAFGIAGTTRDVEAGNDFKVTEALGPLVTARGERRGKRWWQDENGYTVRLQGVHQRDAIDKRAFERVLTNQTEAGIRLVGETSSPMKAYVVEISPQGGRHSWLFFDRDNGRMVRIESVYKDARVATTFDDFRTANGVTTAWHVHTSDGRKFNDIDSSVTSLRLNVPVAPSDLDIPDNRRTVVEFPSGQRVVSLPARVEDGVIIVRVNVADRGLDFQLDSGSSSIVIDRDVAGQLGLRTLGLRTETVAGTFEASQTVIPEMDVGTLKLRNVVVDSLPFNYQWDPQTKIVGLLGYDFIADTMLKVDYMKGTATAYDPAANFIPPGQSFTIPAALDDAVPMVGAKVGDSVGDHFILDTGAWDVMIFSDFVASHPADVADLGLGKTLIKRFPFLDMRSGVGGEIEVRPTQVKAFHFGAVNFQNFVLWTTHAARAFEGEDADGLIGYGFLHFFDVYLDYRNSRVLLAPNELLLRATGNWPPK
jgi:hypothetical protein